jgi:proteasome accessory factor A
MIGLETEYGIMAAADPSITPMLASALLVWAYRDSGVPWAAWDYSAEDPLADARGFHLQRAAADRSMLTDHAPIVPAPSRPTATPGQGGPTAIVIANGARLYVDHAHPEYSGPECSTALEAALWDAAGDRIVQNAAETLAATGGPHLDLYKNNTDGKGAAYGCHENYLVPRTIPFSKIVDFLTPFLVTRQIITGSGRVGLGPKSEKPGFQLSQRADFVETEIGLETTLRRPIINTRDEPHSDPNQWRRLHVIVGDATVLPIATYLRVGITSLVLEALIQGGDLGDHLRLAAPVDAFHQVSRDLTLQQSLPMADGSRRSALSIQHEYCALVSQIVGSNDLLERWSTLLDQLIEDPANAARQIEWLAKYQLLDGLRQRAGCDWSNPRLQAADLQWAALDPARSLAARLIAAGRVEPLFTDEQVTAAMMQPPQTTRAGRRGRAVAEGTAISAGWDRLVLRSGQVVPLTELLASDYCVANRPI